MNNSNNTDMMNTFFKKAGRGEFDYDIINTFNDMINEMYDDKYEYCDFGSNEDIYSIDYENDVQYVTVTLVVRTQEVKFIADLKTYEYE